MSIKRKLTLMMMGISLMAVVLTVTAITAYLIYDMKKSKIQQLEVTAALTGDRNGAALVFSDSDRVRRNLEIFRLNPSVLATCIYDGKGMLFSGYSPDDGKLAVPCPPMAGGARKMMSGNAMLTAFAPIEQNGSDVGSVFMAVDTREIQDYVNKILLISATATALVFLMTLLLTVYLQRTISRPILELAATAQSITANRDYTLEAKTASHDETGLLARAFNEMLGEVRKRDGELRQANETLEQKVHDRTHQLEEAKCKAEAASAAKSEFLRNMSHELRTPLHALISFSSYGIKEYESATRAKLKEYFEIIEKGSERLSRLVDEVLDLARLEQGKQMFLLKRGDMQDLAQRAADMVKPLLEEKKIALQLERACATSLMVCDHDKIMQVMTNLLANAIKFTPSGKGIILRIAGEGEEVDRRIVVSVIDEGVGIPEEEKEAIFESFRQSSRTKTGAGGTGLGLAICRSIIEAHGGHISAQNNANGTGSCITFAMPAVTQEGNRLITLHTTEGYHADAA